MKKSINIIIEPIQDFPESIRLNIKINGFGVKSLMLEEKRVMTEFDSFFDIIWEDVGEKIKKYYLKGVC